MSQSDQELLKRYLSGEDPDAFAHLVRRYVDFVYSSARRQVRDEHLAEDITQNVLLLLLKKVPQLEGHENLGGWLFRAAMLESRNTARTRKREAARVKNAIPMNEADRSTHRQMWNEVEPHLNEALESLNEGEREAVVLRYFQRHSYDRVASALGVNEATARQRVHRGLDHMRDFLSKKGVVAEAAVLSAAIKVHGVIKAPAHLTANTLAQAANIQAALAAGKSATGFLASLQSKIIAAVLILMSGGIAIGVVVVTAHRHRASETMYVDLSPPSARNNVVQTPKPQAPPIRRVFDFIRAVSHDDNQGTRPVGGFIGYINKGDWLRFNGVDLGPPGSTGAMFGAMIDCPQKYAGNTMLVHLDGLDGPVIATLTIQSTGGYGHWKAQFAPLETSRSGVHDLVLEFNNGGWNIDGFRILLTSRPGTDPIPAVSFNEAQGVQTRAGMLSEISDGFWVRYDGLDFGSGVNAVAITYSCDVGHAGGKIGVKLDRPDGRLVGELPVQSTGSFNAFATRIIPIEPLSGPHSIVLTFTGKWHGLANVQALQFLRDAGPSSRPSTQVYSESALISR